MPKESAGDSVKPRSGETSDRKWDRIGINAVAAASMCQSYDRKQRKQDNCKSSFPHRETEFATD